MPEPKTFTFKYKNMLNKDGEIPLKAGEIIFVLGANGTGKSGLMTSLYSQNSQEAKRISAHRQTWLNSNVAELTHANKEHLENAIRAFDTNPNSRWTQYSQEQRSQITIMNLIHAQNAAARGACSLLRTNPNEAVKLSQNMTPLEKLNELLQNSNLAITISINADEKILSTKHNGKPFSVAQLSDGERNAVLIAAEVLTAEQSCLLIIDEPERHLHRSIISPLLSSLFRERPDCAFVIATHDISLLADNPESSVLVTMACECQDESVTRWDLQLIKASDQIDEKVKKNILGSRRTIIFVEGERTSLDHSIYTILFPGISVIPKGPCGEVVSAVKGINEALALHWLNAFGIIDSDDRQAKEIEELKQHKIYALSAYSVESIYYSRAMIHNMAMRASNLHDTEPANLESDAKKKIIECITEHKKRMCSRVCERKIRDKIVPPKWQDIPNTERFTLNIEIKSEYDKEQTHFDELIESENIDGIIARYPVRETQMLAQVAKALKFQCRGDYEHAVRKLLKEDADIRLQTKTSLGEIATAIAEATTDVPKR